MHSVAVIDYGMGNTDSVVRAFEKQSAQAFLCTGPHELSKASHIVIPGVGSFPRAMRNLRERGFVEALQSAALQGVPLLGICLGMQVLATTGTESEECAGLGIVPGAVVKFEPLNGERVPHVGWNEVQHCSNEYVLFQGIEQNTDFYFVHSYHFVPDSANSVLARTPYCNSFVSAVGNKNACGVQFHPEKSGRGGLQLLRNFLES